MIRLIKQTNPIARKEYLCDLHDEAGEVEWPKGKLTFTELRAMANYHNNKRRIKKGERYVKQVCEYEGQIYTWRANKGIYDIFNRFDLFKEY